MRPSPPTKASAPRASAGVAERSILAFERIHGLNVTVHDLSGTLSRFLRADRFHHRSAICCAVKAEGRLEACIQFEMFELRADLAGRPEGRIHVCHAGLVEWAVPVFEGDNLCWVIFAGPRRPSKELLADSRVLAMEHPRLPTIPGQELPAEVGPADAVLIMEHLRQLVAWLRLWIEDSEPVMQTDDRFEHKSANDPAVSRAMSILRFIDDNYAATVTLAMLAKRLHLSEGRASHVVRSCCHGSFRDLLLEKRLRVAMELLRQSGMNVSEVAAASGFDSVAHFHRLFRRRVGHTPAQYRINGQS